MDVNRWGGIFRKNMLFFALLGGALVFCAFHYLDFMQPLKPAARAYGRHGLPALIFTILFLSFCRIKIHDMRPRWWHGELVLIQVGVALLPAWWLARHPDCPYAVAVEGFILCVITPTAAAAATITGRLGGNESSVTTYTILSNLAAAVSIPLIFPLFTAKLTGTFADELLTILSRVFPVIVMPLVAAFAVRLLWPAAHRWIVIKISGWGFYLWSVSLVSVAAEALANIVNSRESAGVLWLLAGVGMGACALQFGAGKALGQPERQRISAGQGLGQKNMVFGLWTALSFLSPTAAIAPGCYILWQNLVNAWQLWYKDRRDRRREALGLSPYQE